MANEKALKPSVGKHRLAADIFVALVQRFGVMKPTPVEGTDIARAAYAYAETFLAEGDKRQ